MHISKFFSLDTTQKHPLITQAYDQPDVYETGDDVSDETSDFYEEENECIERLHISTRDSINRFKGKYLTGPIDFSDRIGPKSRTGYDARSSEWELAGEGERETPIQRCRRLQCEMEELLQDIAAIQVDKSVSKEDKESYETVGTVVSSARKVLDSLRLEQILGRETTTATAESEVQQLMQHIDEYQKSGGTKRVQLPASRSSAANASDQLELKQSTRVAQLEHRLHRLEQAVGAKTEKLSRLAAELGAETLLDGIQQLSTRAALLQPSQLDLIEVRLTNLATKMDAIAEKKSATGQDASREQKTLELYEIAKRTEPITQILPDMLDRMQALESLHSYGKRYDMMAMTRRVIQFCCPFFSHEFQ